MATTKTIQATVKNRTDTAANWTQKNPVLAEGEIIVVQTSAGETRLKIGDGVKTFTQLPYIDEQIYNNVVTSVNGQTGDVTLDVSGGGTDTPVQSDWNQNDETASDYIKNRPFFATGGVQNITWDGDTTNKTAYGDVYYHVSDLICDKNDFIGAVITTNSNTETITIATAEELNTTNDGQATKNLLSFHRLNGNNEVSYVLYCLKDNTVYNNITFSKSGIYFLYTDYSSKFYTSKLTFPKMIGRQYKTLDSYYLPIATASTAGTIKVGNGLSISADGTLSVTTATYYTGTADPVNTLGVDGDLYLKTEG